MRKVLLVALRFGLGAVFVYAGLMKVWDPVAFADSVASFRMLPDVLVSPVALALPMFELLLGGLLWVPRWTATAAAGLVMLCAIFGVALGTALARGLEIDCGCFGKSQWSSQPWVLLGRDVLLGLAALTVLADTEKNG
jgi:putative oxidoreductase